MKAWELPFSEAFLFFISLHILYLVLQLNIELRLYNVV